MQATKQSGVVPLYLSVVALLVMAGLFTIAGGLTAVIYTDFAQVVLMVLGACFVTVTSEDSINLAFRNPELCSHFL